MTNHLRLVPSLRVSGAISPLPHTPSFLAIDNFKFVCYGYKLLSVNIVTVFKRHARKKGLRLIWCTQQLPPGVLRSECRILFRREKVHRFRYPYWCYVMAAIVWLREQGRWRHWLLSWRISVPHPWPLILQDLFLLFCHVHRRPRVVRPAPRLRQSTYLRNISECKQDKQCTVTSHWGAFVQPLLQWKSSNCCIFWVCL
jgi:hypothetical protein